MVTLAYSYSDKSVADCDNIALCNLFTVKSNRPAFIVRNGGIKQAVLLGGEGSADVGILKRCDVHCVLCKLVIAAFKYLVINSVNIKLQTAAVLFKRNGYRNGLVLCNGSHIEQAVKAC